MTILHDASKYCADAQFVSATRNRRNFAELAGFNASHREPLELKRREIACAPQCGKFNLGQSGSVFAS